MQQMEVQVVELKAELKTRAFELSHIKVGQSWLLHSSPPSHQHAAHSPHCSLPARPTLLGEGE